jgi:hypothetical protein
MNVPRTVYLSTEVDSKLDRLKKLTGHGKGKLINILLGDDFDLMESIEQEDKEVFEKYIRIMAFR